MFMYTTRTFLIWKTYNMYVPLLLNPPCLLGWVRLLLYILGVSIMVKRSRMSKQKTEGHFEVYVCLIIDIWCMILDDMDSTIARDGDFMTAEGQKFDHKILDKLGWVP
eukprot:UN14779